MEGGNNNDFSDPLLGSEDPLAGQDIASKNQSRWKFGSCVNMSEPDGTRLLNLALMASVLLTFLSAIW